MGLVAGATIGFASPATATEATVERVVDGDTIDVRMPGGSLQRVRLLNIDTPETVDPNRPVECLGPEATAFVESQTSPGDLVDLEFDHERTDRYGRLLAHVRLSSGRLLSEEIAAAGLGVPISIGQNSSGYSSVADAANRAASKHVGYFDPETECTFPAQAAELGPALDQAAKVDMGSTAAEALAAAEGLDELAEPFKELSALILIDNAFIVRSHSFARSNVTSALNAYDLRYHELRDFAWEAHQLTDERETAEAEKKAKRKAAEAERKAKKKAQKEAAERARKKALKRARLEAERRQAEQQERDNSSGGSSGGGNPYPGYNGPRCYEPGGKVWHPC